MRTLSKSGLHLDTLRGLSSQKGDDHTRFESQYDSQTRAQYSRTAYLQLKMYELKSLLRLIDKSLNVLCA